jgi:hypothetical protein
MLGNENLITVACCWLVLFCLAMQIGEEEPPFSSQLIGERSVGCV